MRSWSLRPLVVGVPVVALVAALGACSGDPGGAGAAAPPATAAGAPATPADATPADATPADATPADADADAGAAPSETAPSTAAATSGTGPAAAPGRSASERSSTAPPAVTGDVGTTVAPRDAPTTSAGRVGERAPAGDRATVAVTALRHTETVARLPGEVGGSAVAATVAVTNRSAAPLDLTDAVVTVTGPGDQPGAVLSGPPARALPATVRPRRTVRGTYVFALPVRGRTPVTVAVSVSGEGPVLSYEGTVS